MASVPRSTSESSSDAAPECVHRAILTRKTFANGTVHYVRQCLKCGEKTTAWLPQATLSDADMGVAPPFDDDLAERVARERWDASRAAREYDRLNRTGTWWSEYDVYLNAEAWQAKRRRVMQRAGWYCEGCGERRAVEVHHVTYRHRGNEFLWELRAVCKQCHERLTEESRGAQ